MNTLYNDKLLFHIWFLGIDRILKLINLIRAPDVWKIGDGHVQAPRLCPQLCPNYTALSTVFSTVLASYPFILRTDRSETQFSSNI